MAERESTPRLESASVAMEVEIDGKRFKLLEFGKPLPGCPFDILSLDAEVTMPDGTKIYGPEHPKGKKAEKDS